LKGAVRNVSRAALARRFVLAEREARIGDRRLTLLLPHDVEALLDEEAFAADERLPYWADLWPSAVVLAGVLAQERGGGRPLLELGCGLGLVSIGAMLAGYATLATDYYDDALRFTAVNARTALGRAPAVRLVNWRALPADLGRFARVVAADVLYEKEYGALVPRVIDRTLARDGLATVADPGRSAAPDFVRQCEALGLGVAARPPIPYREGSIRQRIQLYDVRRVRE
jgi:predicted nicotinamide N-methyase